MRHRQPRVLIVGPDAEWARTLAAFLRGRGMQVRVAHDDETAYNALDDSRVDALIAPLRAPRIDGLALLRRARARVPEASVILTGEGADLERGIRAMREGAAEFVIGALIPERALAMLERGFERQALAARLEQAEARLDQRYGLSHLVTHSAAMRRVLEQIGQVAATRVPVLILGAPGSGRRMVAQAIHQNGPRRDEPFVWVACDVLTREEAESELFGQDSDSPAGGPRAGRFERADGGTLFLGEVGALPTPAQAALLRALHDRSFVRVGGRETQSADVRVLAATERDLSAEVAAGRFRSDLAERLSTVRIQVPALRERSEDLPLLIQRMLAELNREYGRRVTGVTRGVLERFAAYAWPGNVRELRDRLESMVALADGKRSLEVSDLPAELQGPAERRALSVTVGMTVEEVERELISATLRRVAGDKRRAAALLGIGLRTLYRKVREFGLG
ncbi:MAG TPA: sigma-54 dependent transcriptional regulator [Candidatus Sulfotelmatobacter sp.]|nr:sigma-54 dependent transcriptional regulator [Candidatus Sulfotelmatobacter sp.]